MFIYMTDMCIDKIKEGSPYMHTSSVPEDEVIALPSGLCGIRKVLMDHVSLGQG